MLIKKESSIVLTSLLMGLIGGFLSNQGLPTLSAAEPEMPPNSRETPQHSSQQVTTEALVLTDQKGKPRARFEITPEGEPQLVLLDQKGTILAQLGTQSTGLPELRLNDKDGEPRIHVALTAEGAPFLQLNAKGESPHAKLSVTEKGTPRLELTSNPKERPAAMIGLAESGSPEFELRESKGEGMASLYFVNHNPRLLLRDKEEKIDVSVEAILDEPSFSIHRDGKIRTSLASDHFLLMDKEKTPRLSLRVHKEGEPSITLKDKDGSRLASLSIQPLPKTEEPLFALYDKKDRIRAGLNLDEDGRPNFILRDKPLLSLVDEDGNNGIYLSLEGNDRPSIYLSALEGKREAFLGLRKNGELAFDMMNGKGFPRASFLLDAEGTPQLQMRDKDERLLWSIPTLEN